MLVFIFYVFKDFEKVIFLSIYEIDIILFMLWLGIEFREVGYNYM